MAPGSWNSQVYGDLKTLLFLHILYAFTLSALRYLLHDEEWVLVGNICVDKDAVPSVSAKSGIIRRALGFPVTPGIAFLPQTASTGQPACLPAGVRRHDH